MSWFMIINLFIIFLLMFTREYWKNIVLYVSILIVIFFKELWQVWFIVFFIDLFFVIDCSDSIYTYKTYITNRIKKVFYTIIGIEYNVGYWDEEDQQIYLRFGDGGLESVELILKKYEEEKRFLAKQRIRKIYKAITGSIKWLYKPLFGKRHK